MKVLLWVGLGIILVIGVAVFGFFGVYSSTKAELQPLAEAFLEDVRDGEFDDAYARTSSIFRAATTQQGLQGYMAYREQLLGAYKSIVDVKGFQRSAGTGQKSIGSITVDIEFEKGVAEGEFQFQKEGGAWMLNKVSILVPDALAPEPDESMIASSVKANLSRYNERKFANMHANFTKEARKRESVKDFEKRMRAVRDGTDVVERWQLTDEVVSDDRRERRLTYLVFFKDGKKTTLEIKLVWRNAFWQTEALSINPV